MAIFINMSLSKLLVISFICHLKILSRFYYFETFWLVTKWMSRTSYRGAFAPKKGRIRKCEFSDVAGWGSQVLGWGAYFQIVCFHIFILVLSSYCQFHLYLEWQVLLFPVTTIRMFSFHHFLILYKAKTDSKISYTC